MNSLLVFAIILILIGGLAYYFLPKPIGVWVGIICGVIIILRLLGLV